MKTAIRRHAMPVNPTQLAGEAVDGSSLLKLIPEQQLRQTADRVAWLQSKVNELRRALAQARRKQFHQELLLRNSRLRELELRAQLIEGRQTDETQT
jgi:hypothetical protein